MNKKGIVFTLDATFALVIVTGVIVFLFFNLSNISNDGFHSDISSDLLEVLEYSGRFEEAILTDDSSVLGVLVNESLGSNFCSELEVYNSTSVVLSSNSGVCNSGNNKVVSYRSFFVDGINYYAKMEVFVD